MEKLTSSLDVAVLFIIYNRPDTTTEVFEQIRKARPAKLYIAADGPKNQDDNANCLKSRKIATDVDWACEVKTKFSDINLNCGKGPYQAMKWFFENEEKGIILEDDCFPELSFFRYCKELLDKYNDDERIMMISGDNFLRECNSDKDYSYYFSNFSLTWGWASWRRVWQKYDYTMKNFPELMKKKYLDNAFLGIGDKWYRLSKISSTFKKGPYIDWWDYQWQYNLLTQSGLCIVPNVNMIKNIGFNSDATHTKNHKDKNGYIDIKEINFPLTHPSFIMRNIEADKKLLSFFLKAKVKAKISKYLHVHL